jgi:putative redox protein
LLRVKVGPQVAFYAGLAMTESAHDVHVRENEVYVTGPTTGFAQQIAVGPHHLSADEPLAAGGSDTGPTPYQLLLAALGSCTSMTLAAYARHKQWPLLAVRVRLRHSKIHAADCMRCETEVGLLDRIDREIEMDGALTGEQRARLLEIADRCPVHRTLKAEIDISTRLV